MEKQHQELSLQIAQEELAQPTLTRDQIIVWLHRFRKLDTTKLEHRRRLINRSRYTADTTKNNRPGLCSLATCSTRRGLKSRVLT